MNHLIDYLEQFALHPSTYEQFRVPNELFYTIVDNKLKCYAICSHPEYGWIVLSKNKEQQRTVVYSTNQIPSDVKLPTSQTTRRKAKNVGHLLAYLMDQTTNTNNDNPEPPRVA